MSTTKVTTQKVSAVLKKAGLTVSNQSSRFSSGYNVRGIYADYSFIEIDYTNGSRHTTGSYTANQIEKLTSAASVLLEAGITVLMSGKIPLGKFDSNKSSRYDEYKLYVRKDGAPQTNNEYAHWDVDEITNYFSDKVAQELADEAADRAEKDAKKLAAEQAQAERLARVDLLNPTIGIDHTYLEGLFTTHVTLLDGRMAVLKENEAERKQIGTTAKASLTDTWRGDPIVPLNNLHTGMVLFTRELATAYTAYQKAQGMRTVSSSRSRLNIDAHSRGKAVGKQIKLTSKRIG